MYVNAQERQGGRVEGLVASPSLGWALAAREADEAFTSPAGALRALAQPSHPRPLAATLAACVGLGWWGSPWPSPSSGL